MCKILVPLPEFQPRTLSQPRHRHPKISAKSIVFQASCPCNFSSRHPDEYPLSPSVYLRPRICSIAPSRHSARRVGSFKRGDTYARRHLAFSSLIRCRLQFTAIIATTTIAYWVASGHELSVQMGSTDEGPADCPLVGEKKRMDDFVEGVADASNNPSYAQSIAAIRRGQNFEFYRLVLNDHDCGWRGMFSQISPLLESLTCTKLV